MDLLIGEKLKLISVVLAFGPLPVYSLYKIYYISIAFN